MVGRLVAVLVAHNRRTKLEATLSRLCALPHDMLHGVVVFNNASTDGTADLLAAQDDPRLIVVNSEINLGGAGGFESGMRAAVERFDPDWLLLMDDDARPAEEAVPAFQAVPRADADVWAAAVYYPDGRICEMNRPWINPFRRTGDLARALFKGKDGFHLTAANYADTEISEIDGASFVGLFVSRAAISRVGYPDGKLFLYGDDVLYTLSISQSGGRIAFDPTLRFEHDCETFSDASASVMKPLWKVYYFHRNQVLVYRQAAGPILFWPVLALRAFGWWRRSKSYGIERSSYLRLLRLALKDGLAKRTERPHADILTMAETIVK